MRQVEVEFKLDIDARDLPALRRRLAAFGAAAVRSVETVYYDSPGFAWATAGCAVRLRRLGEGRTARWVQSLKREEAGGALARRSEWEIDAPGGRFDLALFPAAAVPASLAPTDRAALEARFRTRFRRSTWTVEHHGATLEIALDVGEIVAGRRREPLRELELEVVAGPPEAAVALALDLATSPRPLRLRPAVRSKAERGTRLAAAGRGTPPPWPATAADAGMSTAGIGLDDEVATVARRLVVDACTILLRNAIGIETTGEPEFVHQSRVALRRLRAYLGVLGAAAQVPRDRTDDIAWLARAYGAARDADVLALETLPALEARLAPSAAGARAARSAGARRRRARAELRRALASAAFAATVLRLLAWAARRAAPSPTLRATAGRTARRELARWRARVRHPHRLDRDGRHRARKATKRLRYALELLRETLAGSGVRRWLARLRKLQESAGRYRNAVVALETLEHGRTGGAWGRAARAALEREIEQAWRRSERRIRSLAATDLPTTLKGPQRGGT